jgi:neurocalcin delta
MGNESSSSTQLNPSELNDLKEQTTFSRAEIRDLFKKFSKDCPSGQMNIDDFKAMYETLFPSGDSGQFADHVFKAYDKDGNGVIDFKVRCPCQAEHSRTLFTP